MDIDTLLEAPPYDPMCRCGHTLGRHDVSRQIPPPCGQACACKGFEALHLNCLACRHPIEKHAMRGHCTVGDCTCRGPGSKPKPVAAQEPDTQPQAGERQILRGELHAFDATASAEELRFLVECVELMRRARAASATEGVDHG